MSGLKFEMKSPVTQKPEAVEALATFLNRTIDNGVLDLGTVKLVKSNKGDAFYTVTSKACSCPSHYYRGGACKHQRKLFPSPLAPKPVSEEPLIQRGGFKPFLEA